MNWWDLLFIFIIVFLAVYAAALSIFIRIAMKVWQLDNDEEDEE